MKHVGTGMIERRIHGGDHALTRHVTRLHAVGSLQLVGLMVRNGGLT